MLNAAKMKQVKELVAGLDREELIWLNGYLSGLATPSEAPVNIFSRITIAYGTETGNSKRLASLLALATKSRGIQAKLVALDQYRHADLEKEECLLLIVSTHGEGEPPAAAKKFFDYILSGSPQLHQLKYAVLALGDSSYPLFCKAGEDADLRLHQLGAQRIRPLAKSDLDHEADGAAWIQSLLKVLAANKPGAQVKTEPAVKPKTRTYYQGKILSSINLHGRGSEKQTFHIEIGTEEAVDYLPGDSLAIIPKNRREVVDEILRLTGADGESLVEAGKHRASIRELLTEHLGICYLLGSTMRAYGKLTGHDLPEVRMDLKDLLRIYPVRDAGQFVEVIALLKPISPRLYSISSSPNAHPGELHLTVSKHSFLLQDEQHYGLCSEFLGDLSSGEAIGFYIHPNRSFRLPQNDLPLIMIGAGTGIAPYRSFIAEREAQGLAGKSWLFFGERHFTTDFLYQTEWQNWLSTGALTRINLAFSRDRPQKFYVQHQLQHHAKEVYEWIEDGAQVYLSGAKAPMGMEAEATLLQLIASAGQKKPEEARAYLNLMKEDGRYCKEVY